MVPVGDGWLEMPQPPSPPHQGRQAWQALCQRLFTTLITAVTPIILVSNEVGWGIVPDNPMAREFRDRAGWLHQKLAQLADLVILVVAGLPLILKGAAGPGNPSPSEFKLMTGGDR